MADGSIMPIFGIGSTCIGDQGNQVAEVTCIAYRGADTLIGKKPAYNKEIDTKVAQNIMNVGRKKDARGGLRE